MPEDESINNSQLLKAALGYAQRGWPMFPVKPGEKIPAIKDWPNSATTDPEQIRTWWGNEPKANIGIVTGSRSGLVVVDIDKKNGGSLDHFLKEYNPVETPRVQTPSGGWHLFYELPQGMVFSTDHKQLLGKGVDFQAERAFVVAVPSVVDTQNGPMNYTWEVGPTSSSLAQLPRGLVTKLKEPQSPRQVDPSIQGKIMEGGRDNHLTSFGGRLRRQGLSEPVILVALREENEIRCKPPLSEEDLKRIAHSVARYSPALATGGQSDQATFERLAKMSHSDFDRVKKNEADRMGVSVTALTRDVEEARRRYREEKKKGGISREPEDVEPWDEPVDGRSLLETLTNVFCRYVILPEYAAETLAMWTVHTYTLDVVDFSPVLMLVSPEKRCGKTTVIKLLDRLTRRPMRSDDLSAAALFRSIEEWHPTMLMDEADAWMKDNNELRGIINSKHSPDGAVQRVEGENREIRWYSTWCAKAIAGIGKQAGTVMDRSIIIKMRRKLPEEQVAKLRRKTEAEEFRRLSRQIARWVQDRKDELGITGEAREEDSLGLDDRQADNWEPLLAIADAVGSQWPELARRAAKVVSGGGDIDDSDSIGELLLADIREIFTASGKDRLTTKELIEELDQFKEHPWPTRDHGKLITPNQLATILKRFEIKSKTIRIANGTPKGYYRDDFSDAFNRYLDGVATADQVCGGSVAANVAANRAPNSLKNSPVAPVADVLPFFEGENKRVAGYGGVNSNPAKRVMEAFDALDRHRHNCSECGWKDKRQHLCSEGRKLLEVHEAALLSQQGGSKS